MLGLGVVDIGVLIDVTGGVLGLFIMFIFPTLFVFKGRQMLKKYTTLDYKKNPHRSYFSSSMAHCNGCLDCLLCCSGCCQHRIDVHP